MDGKMYDKLENYGDSAETKFGFRRIKKTQVIISKILSGNQIKRCLDVGCGTGYFTNFVKRNSPKTICFGIDISKKAIEKASGNYPENIFIRKDIKEFSLTQNDKFDLILSLENIEHIYNLDEYLATIDHLLSNNGILVISTPNLNSYMNRVLVFLGKIPYFQEYFFEDTVPIFSIGKKDFPSRNSTPSGHIRVLNSQVLDFIAKKFNYKIIGRYGAGLYAHKKILGFIDLLFSYYYRLSSCIIYVYKKERS